MGIKRKASKKGERTQKLDRGCKVLFRLCILKNEGFADNENRWTTVHWAQIVTDSIKCGKFLELSWYYKLDRETMMIWPFSALMLVIFLLYILAKSLVYL